MLAVKHFPSEYVTACRRRFERQREAAGAAPDALLCGTMLLALEASFVHRQRGMEAKGGALKELRDRCEAVVNGDEDGPAPDELDRLAAAAFAELEERFVAEPDR